MKIQGQNKEMLAAACQMFLGKTEAEIAHIALETLEGHQRAIMAHMTVEVGLRRALRPGATGAGLSQLWEPEPQDPELKFLLPPSRPRKSIRTGRSSQSRFSKWPPQTW